MALKLIFFPNFFVKDFFLNFLKFSRHADLRGFGVAACENVPAWRRPAAACITGSVITCYAVYLDLHAKSRYVAISCLHAMKRASNR